MGEEIVIATIDLRGYLGDVMAVGELSLTLCGVPHLRCKVCSGEQSSVFPTQRHPHLHIIPRYARTRRVFGITFDNSEYPGHYAVSSPPRHLDATQMQKLTKVLRHHLEKSIKATDYIGENQGATNQRG